MKKFLCLFAGAAFLFSACSDNDNAGNGGDNGSDELRTVFVKSSDIHELPSSLNVDRVAFYVDYGSSDHALVTANWQNGFTMKLPATVSSTYLSSISSLINLTEGESDTNTVVISNSNARVTTYTYFELFNSADATVGYVYVTGNNDNWEVFYLYSDRDVNVKGTRTMDEYKDIYDLELKQGWNRVAWSDYVETTNGVESHIYHVKTELPSQLDWKYTNDIDE